MTAEKPQLVQLIETWSQPNDCCDGGTCGQALEVKAEDGGGGFYLVIETKRWAVDDVDAFAELLKGVLRRVQK